MLVVEDGEAIVGSHHYLKNKQEHWASNEKKNILVQMGFEVKLESIQ
jgi:hypothetical protein